MLDRTYLNAILAKHRTPLCINHVLGQGVNRRLAFHIDTFDLVSMVLGCGIKRNLYI